MNEINAPTSVQIGMPNRRSADILPLRRALETIAVLPSASADDSTFSRIVQLLLLTGQRRNEIASLRVDWIDFKNRTIKLPPHITKNKRQHTFPFGKTADAVLKVALAKPLVIEVAAGHGVITCGNVGHGPDIGIVAVAAFSSKKNRENRTVRSVSCGDEAIIDQTFLHRR